PLDSRPHSGEAGSVPVISGNPSRNCPPAAKTSTSCLVLIASLFTVAVIAGCLPAAGPPKLPDDLRTAKIDYGKADFDKKVFDEYSDLGLITDLHYGRFDQDGGPELAVVGT